VRHLQPPVDTAHHQPFLAPVELERLAQFERQRHERRRLHRLAFALAPRPDEVGQPRVAALVTGGPDLLVQRPRRAPLALGSVRVGLQRLLDRLVVRRELGRPRRAFVLRLLDLLDAQVLAHRVARQARRPRDLAYRLVLPVVHPTDLANHGHGDHSSLPLLHKNAAG
jgi:hypothetical protein